MTVLFADSDEDFEQPSYLATAIRLSIPGLGREATEDEIMNDIEKLENNEPLIELDPDQKYGIRPEKGYMEFPGKRYMEFPGKRYMEFPGKRYMEFPGKRNIEVPRKRYMEFVGKRFLEFPGKRYTEFPGKRYFEFPGKRDLKSTEDLNADNYRSRTISKRYHEFLGKRNTLLDDTDNSVYKRWAEFLGKRSQGVVGNHAEELSSYFDKSNSEHDKEEKRFSEFIG